MSMITDKLQFNEHQAMWPNFSYEELACQHTSTMNLSKDFLIELQKLREAVDMPLTITSGYRCSTHPIEARKSTPGKHHTIGAVDIAAQGSSAIHILKVALATGWTGIGINVPSFIHLDRREEPTIWKY